MSRLRFQLDQLRYDVGASMLVVPAAMAAVMGAAGLCLAELEVRWQFHTAMFAFEPGTAQAILATLAGSMMSVVSVVYSVLLVALSLASVQFSTRILSGMVRDRLSQAVLGLFLGTFVWQLVALRSLHFDPAYVPPITVTIALVLAVTSLGALVVFIDRVIHNIQANNLVNRIATETEAVIDDVFPPRDGPVVDASWPEPAADAQIIRATRSGYVQLVSVDDALAAVAAAGARAHLLRGPGAFVPEGAGLWAVSPPCTPAMADALRDAIDLGPIRTMQRDAEWGLRQIVDIGLKAISPAVNDPSTGGLCIDHLSRLLIRAGRRGTPPSVFEAGSGVVVVPGPRYSDLIDLAFDQLRQYGRTDMAITLRLLRAIADIAEAVDHPAGRARLAAHTQLVARASQAAFSADDCEELTRRLARVSTLLALDGNLG